MYAGPIDRPWLTTPDWRCTVLMYRLLRTGKADIYTRDDSDLIHEISSRLRDTEKLVLDLLMMQ